MNRILVEETRSSLTSKGKKGANYAPSNQHLGKNRYQRRLHSKVANQVRQFNRIDMNKLFKDGILTVEVNVKGETNTYDVRMSVGGVVDIIADEVEKNNGTFDLRVVTRAVVTAFNKSDVMIHCTCPDWKYRFAYYALKGNISSWTAQEEDSHILNRTHATGSSRKKWRHSMSRRKRASSDAPDITNPANDKGPACKHVLLVLSNNSWIIKVASVIKNYVSYVEKHYEKQYADIIYPKIYRRDYEDDVQLGLEDSDELQSDTDLIDTANDVGAKSTRFKAGNEYRFQPKNQNKPIPNQTSFDLGDEEEVEI